MNFEFKAANLIFIHNETQIQEEKKKQQQKTSKKTKETHNQY